MTHKLPYRPCSGRFVQLAAFLALFALLFAPARTMAQHDHSHELPKGFSAPAPTDMPASPIKFVENKGQWPPHISFLADVPGGRLFLENNRLVYNFVDATNLHDRFFFRNEDRNAPLTLNCHGVFLEFEGANAQPQREGRQLRKDYHNYFIGNEPDKWAGNCRTFGEVYYTDLYNGIDLRLSAQGKSIKYDLVCAPGAQPASIALRYRGPDEVRIHNGKLIVKTSVNEVVEDAPYAYQEINGQQVQVACEYELTGNVLRYRFPNGYDASLPLVIDPTVVFSTYSGSVADNFGFTATYDDNGDLFAGGIAFGAGYPTTPGAFQTSFGGGGIGGAWTMNGGIDMAITKYTTATSTLAYSTFIGGNANEQPHSLVCAPSGELYIYGIAWSANYPTTSSAYDNTINGNCDIVVTALQPTGAAILGSTFIGGSGEDGLNMNFTFAANSLKHNYGDDARGEIILDISGNVYVASCTKSPNFPATAGSVQTSFGGGTQDGCLMKFNNNLSTLTWCTFLGGSSDDACYGVAVDQFDNVYTTGGTASPNFPTTPGSYQPVYQGNIDGFIARVRADGVTLLSSTYIGTSSYDQSYFIQIDRFYNIYVYGQTTGAGYPFTAGVWGQPTGGQFISRFNPLLSTLQLSTRFGSGGNAINISPTAFLVDVCGYIYVAGWGGSTNFQGTTTGLVTGGGAFQSTTDGSDLYILVLQNNASALDYATFMGGSTSNEHVDGGTSRFNKFAEVYHAVCAGCWGNSDFPTVAPYSATNNSTGCNLACFKIEFPLAGIVADFVANPSAPGCAPHFVNFTNTSNGGTNFLWNFGDGSATVSSFNSSHTFTQPGTYTVMLVASDPNSCNLTDTAYQTIVVLPDPTVTLPNDTTICSGESVTLPATGANNYNWIAGTTGTSSTVTVSPTVTTTYTVVGSNAAGCDDTASVVITVIPSPTANAGPNQTICPGDQAQLNGSGGPPYLWFPPGTLSNPNIANPVATPTSTTNYILTITAPNGCIDRDTITVTVATVNPNAGADQSLCAGDTVQLNATGGGAGGTYVWSPTTGLSNPNIANPQAWPATTTTYTVTITNAFGCTATDQITITVNPLPNVSAFPFTTICQLDTAQINASGAQSYQWTPPATLSNPNGATTNAFPMTTTTYTVVGTDNNGCTNWDTVTVNVLPIPTANAGADVRICEDSLAQLNATGGVSYAWTPPAGLSNPFINNPVASPPGTTNYVVTVTAPNGCTDTDTVQVEVTPTPVVDLVDSVTLCYGQSVRLIASGGTHYLWSTGDTTNNIYVTPQGNVLYTVITWVDGCPSVPDSVWVTVDFDLPIAEFSMDPDTGWVPFTVNFTNLSQNSTSWYWLFGPFGSSTERDPSFEFVEDGIHTIYLIAYNDNGCSDTAYHHLWANDWVLWVPNVFTPNGDGTNDYFITPWMGIAEYHIMIFDRWGMLIFESYDPDFRWNGWFQGKECQEGVYTFVIDGVSIKGNKIKRAGTVTLVR